MLLLGIEPRVYTKTLLTNGVVFNIIKLTICELNKTQTALSAKTLRKVFTRAMIEFIQFCVL